MEKLLEFIKYWGQLLLLPIYWFSFLVPRDKGLWLFGSTFGRRFADNPKYFYLYLNQYKKTEIRAIWISHKKEIVEFLNKNGYEAYYFLSMKGIWYCLRGKVYLFDNYSKDINFWTSGGAKKINLWHGIPLKKIQADNIYDSYRHPKNLWERWRNIPRNISDEKPSNYVLTTSSKLKCTFSSAFRTKNILICGYPRNDSLISNVIENLILPNEQKEMNEVEKFRNIFGKENCKLVFYMPTFRDSEIKFFDAMDLKRFQSFLAQHHILFCIKLHPKSKLKSQFNKIFYENIMVIDSASDPYILLKITDILVTDYSSIYFDFLLLNRPIIFFNYDLEDYLAQSREMYWNYTDITPGKKVGTMDGLMAELMHATISDVNYYKKYDKWKSNIKRQMFDLPSGLASPKLTEFIIKILEKKDM